MQDKDKNNRTFKEKKSLKGGENKTKEKLKQLLYKLYKIMKKKRK